MKRIKLFHQKQTYENSSFIFSQGLEKPMQNDTCQMRKPPNFDEKKHKKKQKDTLKLTNLKKKQKKSQFQTQNPSVMID